jgi:hypothetical protein
MRRFSQASTRDILDAHTGWKLRQSDTDGGVTDMFTNDHHRFFRRLCRGYEYEPATGFDGDGQRVWQSYSLYELLDDGGRHGRVGALLDKGGIEHEIS